jgi:ribonuclease PH
MRPEEVDALMALAKLGCAALFKAQQEALVD